MAISAPSADPTRKHGTVMWRVEGGEGQFAEASGLITSNFFVDEGLGVVDHHFGGSRFCRKPGGIPEEANERN